MAGDPGQRPLHVHPGPPGADLPEDADPLAAWDDFLARVGVTEEQRNTRSAIEDPDGHGPRLFFQQVPEPKFQVKLPMFAQVSEVLEGPAKS